jgi:hypothetical protein
MVEGICDAYLPVEGIVGVAGGMVEGICDSENVANFVIGGFS